MERIKTVGFWHKTMLCLLVLSLIPLLWIGCYNRPSADDYHFSYFTRQAWLGTGSVLEVCKAAGEQMITTYQEWLGIYSAILLVALQPFIFGEWLYALTTPLLLGAYCLAVFYACRKIGSRVLGASDRRIADIVASLVAMLSIQLMPGPVEGFYWWNGAVPYCLFFSLCLFLYTNELVILAEDRCSVPRLLGLLLLGLFVEGGGFPTSLLTLEVGALALMYAVWKRKKVSAKMALLFGVICAGFLLSTLAPGNAVRQARLEKSTVPETLLLSFRYALEDAHTWTTPLFLTAMLFLVPFLWRLKLCKASKSKLFFPLAVALGFCLFASTYAPTVYAMGHRAALRTWNIRYFLWVLLCVLWLFAGIQSARRAVEACKEERRDVSGIVSALYRRYAVRFFAALMICAAFFSADLVLRDPDSIATVSAVKCLANGQAALYGRVTQARLEMLSGPEKDVVLPTYPYPPRLLFFDDIQDDPTDWRNQTLARYYGKNSVRLGDYYR